MSIAPVSAAGVAPPLSPPLQTDSIAPPSGETSFDGIMNRLLGGAAGSQQTAEASLRSLAVGETSNLHSVMLNLAQADLSFRLVLEIRNRLTAAYQEIMKMQV